MGCSCFGETVTKEKKNKIDEEIANNLKKLEKSLCMIDEIVSGFLCKIPLNEKNSFLHVLITMNNNLKIEGGKQIILLLNGNEYKLYIDESRKKYLYKDEYNINIIEIKEDDGFDFNSFLEIDNYAKVFTNLEIYLIYKAPKSISYYEKGKIEKINKNGYKFQYSYNLKNQRPFFSPIINSKNYKVIGITKIEKKNDNFYHGYFINKIIFDFLEDQKNKIVIKKYYSSSKNKNKENIPTIKALQINIQNPSETKIDKEKNNLQESLESLKEQDNAKEIISKDSISQKQKPILNTKEKELNEGKEENDKSNEKETQQNNQEIKICKDSNKDIINEKSDKLSSKRYPIAEYKESEDEFQGQIKESKEKIKDIKESENKFQNISKPKRVETIQSQNSLIISEHQKAIPRVSPEIKNNTLSELNNNEENNNFNIKDIKEDNPEQYNFIEENFPKKAENEIYSEESSKDSSFSEVNDENNLSKEEENYHKLNEITMILKIEENCQNKKQYFLDANNLNDSFKKFDDSNIELYINDKKCKFQNYYDFPEKGEYEIKLKFKIFISDCKYMFSNCTCLKSINLSEFNTIKVTNMSFMFNCCNNLENLNLDSFYTKKVTDMSCMFSYCFKLQNLNLSSFRTNNVTNMSHMFSSCYNLTNLNLSSFNTKKVNNMSYMFHKFGNKEIILVLSSFNTNNVTDMSYMFKNCKLKEINLSNFNTKKAIYMNNMFENCKNFEILNLSSFNTRKANNLSKMFYKCENLKNLEVSSFKTKKATNMSYMFSYCKNLSNLNLSSFHTRNVTDMNHMFSECNNLTNINLSSFKTENVNDMSYMFYRCINLKEINLSFFNTKNVSNMCYMFYRCGNLKNLILSSFDTNNVKDMHSMFEYCQNIQNLDLSSFHTENTTNINNMFSHCDKLESLNLLSFDINHINNGVAFISCNQLGTIKIKKNQISKIQEFLKDSKIEKKMKYE